MTKKYEDILISVIMPVFNKQNFVKEAINSILNQTHRNLELIIIDDGSTDNSKEVILEIEDHRIKFISRDNKGLIFSLNEGIIISRGEFIARMDADDISLPLRLEKQLNKIIEMNAVICGSSYKIIDVEDLSIGSFHCSELDFINRIRLFYENPTAGGSVFIDKNFLIENSIKFGEDNTFCEDLYLFQSVLKRNGKITNISDSFYIHRVTGNSLSTNTNFNISCKDTYKIYNKRFDNDLSNLLLKVLEFNKDLSSNDRFIVMKVLVLKFLKLKPRLVISFLINQEYNKFLIKALIGSLRGLIF